MMQIHKIEVTLNNLFYENIYNSNEIKYTKNKERAASNAKAPALEGTHGRIHKGVYSGRPYQEAVIMTQI